MAAKHILVTGGNDGIGLALCKILATSHGAYVYMGSRSAERGAAGLKKITDEAPEAAKSIELMQIDVGDDASVKAAAESLKSKGVTLYALVNNAGVGFKTGPDQQEVLMNTNFYGPKRVSDAFLPLIDPKGRIVNVSSGAASMWLRGESPETKALFTSPDTTWEQLEAALKAAAPSASMGGYGLSKAALTAYTLQQQKALPNMVITSLSPGFIETKMTSGFGAKLTPEQGTISYIKCLFGDVVGGAYYGSDGLRSPMTCTRDPGTPEYEGEENPDPAKYNK
mmetsp:Transcript_9534/g.18511  ORF Transcript_9534/g.18511 Transcript_9534/m.18511 type:complete len:281 (-) Transcript_9534:53-895(-)